MKLLTIYLVLINIITFLIFAFDKYCAVKDKWRIKEATLLGLCFVGGALGGYVSMQIFRHKTRKQKFTITVPVLLALQIFLIYNYL